MTVHNESYRQRVPNFRVLPRSREVGRVGTAAAAIWQLNPFKYAGFAATSPPRRPRPAMLDPRRLVWLGGLEHVTRGELRPFNCYHFW